jgi:hypothetical protein
MDQQAVSNVEWIECEIMSLEEISKEQGARIILQSHQRPLLYLWTMVAF